jgi:hypothetical protein
MKRASAVAEADVERLSLLHAESMKAALPVTESTARRQIVFMVCFMESACYSGFLEW